MRFGTTSYTATGDEPVHYGLRDHLFGPRVTDDDILALEIRALSDGWDDWFRLILQNRNKRKRRWLLAYLRDDIITVTVHYRADAVYNDDDPFEGMG